MVFGLPPTPAICTLSLFQEEAHFLTKYGSKVYVIHRRDTLRASKVMQQRAKDNPKIEFIWDSAVKEAYGNEKGLLGGVKVENLKTGEIRDLEVRTAAGKRFGCLGMPGCWHLYCDRVLIPPPPNPPLAGQRPVLCHRP